MKIYKRAMCLLLAAAMIIGIAACGNSSDPDDASKGTGSKTAETESSSEDQSAEETSSDGTAGGKTQNQSGGGVSELISYLSGVSRAPYAGDDDETAAEAFVDTDGDFDYKSVKWDGPSGYVIVVPAGDGNAQEAAEYLADYYKRVHSVTLPIVTDATAAVAKEILIGATNRSESNKSLDENELEVALKGGKLVFSGGHYVMTEAAVKRFTRLMPHLSEAFTFKLRTDFTTTLKSMPGYVYTWGDEFEDWYDIDYGKWNYRLGMGGNDVMETSTDRDVIDVSDGRLKLTPCYVFDTSNKELEFKVPWSVATNETMNYVYGYAEIRARVPFYDGIWPSFWGGTACDLKAPHNPDWHAEIDVFENFGTVDTLRPTIHKWYDSTKYNDLFGLSDSSRAHTSVRGNYYTFLDYKNLSNEYHIYGYEWTPTEMKIYIDGEVYTTFNIVDTFDALDDMSMFHDPQYHQFNCHVYSNGDSNPPSLIYNNLALLPACYYIDYFRLYQKDGSELYTDTSRRGTIYNNRVKEIRLD